MKRLREGESFKNNKATTATAYFHIHHVMDAKSMDQKAGTCLRWQELHLKISCQEEASSPSSHQEAGSQVTDTNVRPGKY